MLAKPNPNCPGFAGLRLGLAIVGRARYAQLRSLEACTAGVHRRDKNRVASYYRVAGPTLRDKRD